MKLLFPPSSNNYSLGSSDRDTITSILDGGQPIVKEGKRNPKTLDATWIGGPEDYRYLRAFYHLFKAIPFTCDLINRTSTVTECTVIFIPDTFLLESFEGDIFTVRASLEVRA